VVGITGHGGSREPKGRMRQALPHIDGPRPNFDASAPVTDRGVAVGGGVVSPTTSRPVENLSLVVALQLDVPINLLRGMTGNEVDEETADDVGRHGCPFPATPPVRHATRSLLLRIGIVLGWFLRVRRTLLAFGSRFLRWQIRVRLVGSWPLRVRSLGHSPTLCRIGLLASACRPWRPARCHRQDAERSPRRQGPSGPLPAVQLAIVAWLKQKATQLTRQNGYRARFLLILAGVAARLGRAHRASPRFLRPAARKPHPAGQTI